MNETEREAVILQLQELLGEGDLRTLVREMIDSNSNINKKVAHYKAKLSEEQMTNRESVKETNELKTELIELREKYALREKRVDELSSPDSRYILIDAELRTVKEERGRLDEESRQLSRANIAMSSKLHTLEENYKQQVAQLQSTVDGINKALSDEGISTYGNDHIKAIQHMRRKETELLSAANNNRIEAEQSRDAAIAELQSVKSELLWSRRKPYMICGLRLMPRKIAPVVSTAGSPQRSGSADSCLDEDIPNDISVSIVDVSPVVPPRRIEVRLQNRSIRYNFDEVLPAWSDMSHISRSASEIIAAAFSGIYSSLLLIPADSAVNAMTSSKQLYGIANEIMKCADSSREQQNWTWNIHLTCIELRTDSIRDLLNTDRDYMRIQTAGGHTSVDHEISTDKGIPLVSECASPGIKNISTLTQLLDIAFGNRSTTPDGELRGHVAYIFGMSGSKNGGRNLISGSFTLIDLAADASLPVEIPPGSSLEDNPVVQRGIEYRHKERKYVKKTLAQLRSLFIDHASATGAVLQEKERPRLLPKTLPECSPYRRKYHSNENNLTVGQEVIIGGLTSAEYSHLNGVRGIVLGRSDFEENTDLKGRILVELSHELTLPFLFTNLVPVPTGLETASTVDKVSMRSASPSVASRSEMNGHRSSTAGSVKGNVSTRKKSSRGESKSSVRPRIDRIDSCKDSKHAIQKSHLNQLLKPCLSMFCVGFILGKKKKTTTTKKKKNHKQPEVFSHLYCACLRKV